MCGAQVLQAHWAAASAGALVLNLNTASSAVEVAQCLEDVDCDEVVMVSDARFQSKVNSALSEHGSAPRGSGGVIRWVLWANGEGGIDSSSNLSARSGRLEDVLEGPHKAVIEAREEPDGNAPFACYWTSGTTGRSKCVVLTHRMVATHAVTAAVEMGLNGTDVWAHVRHSAHSFSWESSEGVLTLEMWCGDAGCTVLPSCGRVRDIRCDMGWRDPRGDASIRSRKAVGDD